MHSGMLFLLNWDCFYSNEIENQLLNSKGTSELCLKLHRFVTVLRIDGDAKGDLYSEYIRLYFNF